MKPRNVSLLLGAAASLVLAGCVSTGAPDRKSNMKKAAEANMELGMHYMQLGQLQTAKDKLDSAEKQDPENFRVHWALATLSERIDKPADAERQYKDAVRLAPKDSALANAYAVFLCKTGKADEAVPLFETVMRDKLYGNPAVAATNAGMCLKSNKRNADAAKQLELALSLRPNHTEAVIQLADTQLALGNADAGRKLVDHYLSAPNPSERALMPDVLVVGVRVALAQGERPAADNYARLLMRDFPKSPQAQALPQLLH